MGAINAKMNKSTVGYQSSWAPPYLLPSRMLILSRLLVLVFFSDAEQVTGRIKKEKKKEVIHAND